jgi:pilus assembly protein CpaC
MHRTKSLRRALLGGLVLALLAGGLTSVSQAQDAGKLGSVVIVPLNGTNRLQMTTKKPIRNVNVPKEGVVMVRTIAGDPTTILLIGQAPDVVRIELTDEDGKKETYEVIVQLDIENLKTQLRRGLPTANIDPIPVSASTVLLRGVVGRAEDITIAGQIAQGVGVQVINGLRMPGVQQVQLDVVVAQVSRSEFRRMAFDFLTNSRNFFFGSTVGQAVVQPGTVGSGGALGPASGGLTASPGAPGGVPTNLLFGVVHNGWNFLGFLQALKDESVLKLMAEPRLVTLSGRPASFLSGGEQAVPVPAGLGQVGVQFEEFGTRLNFLPIVLGNGKIHLEVEPEVSFLDPAAGTTIQGTTVPGRTTNRVHTTVELEDGQTFVIGGLIQHQVMASAEKVPVLGEVPFFGVFFSTKSYNETEQELIVLVTPHLVDGQSCDQRTALLPGQETRTPDDFELFLEGILEAPRGSRQICPGGRYLPAYKNGPTADLFPCAGNGDCGAGCANGNGNGHGAAPAAPAGSPPSAAASSAPQAMPLKAQDPPAESQAEPTAGLPAALPSAPAPDGLPVPLPPPPSHQPLPSGGGE